MRKYEEMSDWQLYFVLADAIFNVGVQLNLIDMSSSGREDVALATSATSTKLEDTVSSILGHKFLGTLSPVDISLEQLLKQGENVYNWAITGLVSKNPKGDVPNRTVGYYSINGRVVDIPKITAVLRRVWHGFGGKKKPSCILSFTLPNDSFDINLAPDKQQVLLTHEEEICQLIEEHVTQFWSSQTQGVFEVQKLEGPVEESEIIDAEDDGERPMHKRRFAFVHDITKAKMQHDSDDRHRCAEGEEKKHSEADLEDAGSSPSEGGEPTSKKAKTSSIDEDAPENSSSEVSARIPDDRISDMERRKWAAIQAKFKSGDSQNGVSEMAPLTPEDPSQPEERPTLTKGARVARAQVDAGPRVSGRGNPLEATKNQRQLSLQQFAFQPIGRPTRRSKESGAAARHAVSKSAHEEVAPEQSDNSTRETAEEAHPQRKNLVRRSAARRESGATTEEEDYSPSSGEEPLSSKASTTSPAAPSPSSPDVKLSPRGIGEGVSNDSRPEPVIWTTFKGTEEVCRSFRLERVQMIRRRLDLRGSKHIAVNGQSQDIEQDAKDVTNSVGVSESSKATSISLSKEQFRDEMHVIGQFNMGFILVRCKRNHLWILDQHACDEKYNFENLCRDTIIHEQQLLRPMPLDLSPAEEACILDNMNIFETNGFRFKFESSAPIRQRLSLTGLPHSGARDGRKAVQFGKDDVSTLCTILMDGSSYDAGDGGTGTDGTGRYGNNAVRRYASTASSQFDAADRIIARLPKAIAMFASRACRSSIMIGTALSQKEMDKIVRRLADVEHPWNCPHGRPTMRHVGEILSSFQQDERRAAEYITDPTVTYTPMTQEPTLDEQDENF
jgi:DNA mismatch repair protein PMS2